MNNPSPWGHKLTVSIYVEGDRHKAQRVAECVIRNGIVPQAPFVGIALEAVQDRPIDQAATWPITKGSTT